MSMCRRFHGEPVMRLIVSVPKALAESVDHLIARPGHAARRCRSEFVRLAIAEKLARDGEAPCSANRPRTDPSGARPAT